jgi:hypothetical protein
LKGKQAQIFFCFKTAIIYKVNRFFLNLIVNEQKEKRKKKDLPNDEVFKLTYTQHSM